MTPEVIILVTFILLAIVSFIFGFKLADSFEHTGLGIMLIILGLILIFCSLLVPAIYYDGYVKPSINNEADTYCKNLGYDTFELWEGHGLFPREILYTKCKYADNQITRNVNLNNGK